jgi:transcriptional regulator with XRE-family HTH domain
MTNNKISASRTGIPNPVDIYVGERLKKRRKLLGLTQTELADMLGLSFQQIVKYEKATNRISASRLVDLSNVLEVSISYFFNNMPKSILKQSPRLITNSKDKDNGK